MNAVAPGSTWLDRPIATLAPWTVEVLAWATVLLVALVSRLHDLGTRALSHDESIHALQSLHLLETGRYVHDPAYHGPLLFYLDAIVYWLLGASDATARLGPALAGVGVIAALSLFRRHIGRTAAWLAAVLVTMSPAMLFYSRYLSHDMYVALLSVLWVHAVFRYLESREPRWLIRLALVMAATFVTKEVAFIFGAGIGSFCVLLFAWRWRRGRDRWGHSAAGDAAVVMLTLILPFLAPVLASVLGWQLLSADAPGPAVWRAALVVGALLALGGLIAWSWFARFASMCRWTGLLAIFWAVQVTFFTSFFTNVSGGLRSGIIGSLGYWIGQQPVARGSQPWFYYLLLAGLYELLPLLAGIAGAVAVLRGLATGRRRPHDVTFLAFCVWWLIASWGAYTIAGEKMPWLLVHPLLPLCFLATWWTAQLLDAIDWRDIGWTRCVTLAGGAAIAACLLLEVIRAWPGPPRDPDALQRTVHALVTAAATAALVILLGRRVSAIGRPAARRLVVVGMIALATVLTLRTSARLSYVNYDLATELLVYAHATPDIKQALAEIELVSARTVGGHELEVAYDDASTWPFVWYLRDYPRSRYYGTEPTPDAMSAPVIIVGPKNAAKVRPFVERNYLSRNYRLIWWPINDYTGLGWAQIRQFVLDPSARARTWQIVSDRRYPGVSLARWPNYQPFTMYIRRDIASEAWSVGPEPPATVGAGSASAFPRVVRWGVLAVHAGRYADTPLRRPTALALTPDGALAIVDSGNDRIVVLNPDGTLRLTFGTRCVLADGTAGGCVRREDAADLGDGQFQEPWGVAVTRDGEIYVADSWNGRIQVFDANGRFLRKWGRFGQNPSVDPTTNPLVLYGPRGLAVDRHDRLVVSDTGNKRVVRFDRHGKPLEQVGGAGGGPGRFLEPVGVAVSPVDGSLLVADAWNRRIQRLDDGLRVVGEFAVPGWRGRDALNKPYVAVDAQGWVYAGSPEDARIFVYAADGRPEAIVPLEGAVSPRPAGLAVDVARGQLFVADPANDRILVLPTYAASRGRQP